MIKIAFTDFWREWENDFNFFKDGIFEGEEVVVTNDNPDLLFYSSFGQNHKNFKCPKIFWTGENVRANYDECDLALTFDYNDNPKNLRIPLYAIQWWEVIHYRKSVTWKNPEKSLIESKDPSKAPTEFCSFVHGNGYVGVNGWGNYQHGVVKRNELFDMLNKYKKVSSAGSFMNNMGFRVDYFTKGQFIKNYKFAFAIENSSSPGYVTEKILDPMCFGSIPIYWGSERVEEEFNGKSFINAHKFKNNRELADYIIHLDQNFEEYSKIYSQPFIEGGTLPEIFDLKKTLKNRILSLL